MIVSSHKPPAVWLLGIALWIVGSFGGAGAAESIRTLEAEFLHPPAAARPWVHWFWLDGNITREGITADLEAMERVGIGGVILMDITHETPAGPVGFLTRDWRELFRHAVTEAARLGLEFSANNGAGWSGSGGSWVTPELAMQKLVWSKTNIAGPRKLTTPLPELPKYHGFSRDVSVLAFPAVGGTTRFLPTGQAGIGKYKEPKPGPSSGKTPAIPRSGITNLTGSFSGGQLTWNVPPGNWSIFRFGSMPTGRQNPPARPGGFGLECDKLSKKAVDAHFEGLMQVLIQDTAPAAGRTFTFTHIDSWEVGYQNWTPLFMEEFQRLRGYDPLLYLPAFTGQIVESEDITARFLWDVRRTIADLQATNYAGRLAELAKRHGMKLSAEAYGSGPFDDLLYASKVDVPMSEFWNESDDYAKFHTSKTMASAAHVFGKPVVAAESFTSWPVKAAWRNHPFSLKMLADTAFTYGVNRIVFHRYAHQPWLNLAPGMTMGMWGVHYERTQTWWEYSKPWHEYLARCQNLLQRTRFSGDILYVTSEDAYTSPPTVAELEPAVPAGYDYDLAPPEALFTRLTVENGRLVLPDGARYEVLVLSPSRKMTPNLLRRIRELTEAGATVVGAPPTASPSLMNFPACDRELAELSGLLWGKADGRKVTENQVGAGKIIWGKPLQTVLLERQVLPAFVQNTPTDKPLRRIHQRADDADLFFVANPNAAAVSVDCTFRVENSQPEIWDPATGEVFDSAHSRPAPTGTNLRLALEPFGSRFVVFRTGRQPRAQVTSVTRDGKRDHATELFMPPGGALHLVARSNGAYAATLRSGKVLASETRDLPPPIPVPGGWTVRFPSNAGAPREINLPKLIALNEHQDPGVRHFSGTATYKVSLNVPAAMVQTNRRVFLDLGEVAVLARVRLNGADLGTSWKPPFRQEITDQLRLGENELEVDVANLWPNRLIGDEALPDDCSWVSPDPGAVGTPLREWPEWLRQGKPRPSPRTAFATRRFWPKDAALLRSGLIGPVTVVCEDWLPLPAR